MAVFFGVTAALTALASLAKATFDTASNPIVMAGGEGVTLAGRVPQVTILFDPEISVESGGVLIQRLARLPVVLWVELAKAATVRDDQLLMAQLDTFIRAFYDDPTLGGTVDGNSEVTGFGAGDNQDKGSGIMSGYVKLELVISGVR